MKNNQEWDAEEVKTPEHDEMVLYFMGHAKEIISNRNYKGVIKIEEVRDILTEVPVKAGYHKDFIVGYLDITVVVNFERVFNHKHIRDCFDRWDENRLRCSLNEIDNKESCSRKLFIEVKPKIDNFGNLIRQINKYRETLGKIEDRGDWVIYTKECSSEIEKALASQEVSVILENKDPLSNL